MIGDLIYKSGGDSKGSEESSLQIICSVLAKRHRVVMLMQKVG